MKPVWLTAACLATLLLIACGPQEPIRIGFIGELTGNSADLGEAGRNGAMLAIEQANQSAASTDAPSNCWPATPGAPGHRHQLGQGTARCPGSRRHRDHDQRHDQRPVAGTSSGPGRSGIPTATATKLAGVDDQLFRINWTTRDNAQLYARYCLERGYRRLAAAANENNRVFSESWVKELKLAFEKGGGEIVDTSISNRVPTATCRSSRNCCSHGPMRCFSWPMPAIRPASPSKPASWTRNCR
jgi:branched-chain amino acid transport system substrate-binding protein